MLLSDTIHPSNTIYYLGAKVLGLLQREGSMSLSDLFARMHKERKMSYSMLVLCLDWLYLLNVAIITDKGEVQICI